MTKRPHKDSFRYNRAIAVRILILAIITVAMASHILRPALAYQKDLSLLPISFPAQSPEVTAYFNRISRPEDIITFPFQFAHLLPQVTAGQRLVGFASWKEAERELPDLLGQIEMVMYNPEHWENTPAEEQMDMEATIRRAAELAHAHSLKFVFAPDRKFAEEHLGNVASQIDIVLLQGQRIQDNLPAFTSWISEMVHIARAANPEVKVFVQVGATRGSARQMYEAIEAVAGDIDGVAIWSMPRTLDILQEFVSLLREPSLAMTATPVTSHPPTVTTMLPTTPQQPVRETATAKRTISPTPAEAVPTAMKTAVAVSVSTSLPPSQVPALGAQTEGAPPDLFLAGGALVVGVVLGILIGVWFTRRSLGRLR